MTDTPQDKPVQTASIGAADILAAVQAAMAILNIVKMGVGGGLTEDEFKARMTAAAESIKNTGAIWDGMDKS